MGAHAAPAVPVCLGLLLASGMAWWLEPGARATLTVAAALGLLGLVRSVRSMIAGLLMGWLSAAAVIPGTRLDPTIDLTRPVEVAGKSRGYWSRSTYGWSARLRVESLRQGDRESRGPHEVLLTLPPGPVPPDGARLTARGYLRRPSPLRNGSQRAPPMWRLNLKSMRLAQIESGGRPSLLGAARRGAVAALEAGRGGLGGAVARALLLGETDELPPDWLATLRHAGLGHLMAVSGLHVGMAMAIAWLACAGLPPRLRLIPSGLMVLLYLLLVGGRPSLVRSALMALAALSSLALERKPSSLNAWAVVVSAMVLSRPEVVMSLGFQLTVAATLGLLTLAPRLAGHWSVLPEPLCTGLAASVAAHIATLPWSLCVFHVWTPGAVLLNLIAVPWTALTLTMAMLAVVFGTLPVLGEALWLVMDLMAQPFGFLASLPPGLWSGRPVVAPWGLALAGTGGLALTVYRPGLLSGAVALLALVPAIVLPLPTRHLEMVVLDVGQGEAILLRDGPRAVLVDGGGSSSSGIASRELVPALRRLGLRRLDGVVLTHPDLDHCAGLRELTWLIPVDRLWSSSGWRERCYRDLLLRPGVRLVPVWAGEDWSVGRWRVEVLHPEAGGGGGGNESSLVLRASAGDQRVLLTGDVGLPVEERLARRQVDLSAGILKLGHHGSRTSSGAAFLKVVRPAIAVVSAGRRNIYSHPSEEVLERLGLLGIVLYRTDLGGQIRVRFDPGSGLRVSQPWAGQARPP